MPHQGLDLELTDATLRALNLHLVRVKYSKRVTIPAVWPPSGHLPLIYFTHELAIVPVTRDLIVRSEEIPEIAAQVDSLEFDIPLPSYSLLKIERHEDKHYLFMETSAKATRNSQKNPKRYSLTALALEILKKIPQVAAFYGAIGTGN